MPGRRRKGDMPSEEGAWVGKGGHRPAGRRGVRLRSFFGKSGNRYGHAFYEEIGKEGGWPNKKRVQDLDFDEAGKDRRPAHPKATTGPTEDE